MQFLKLCILCRSRLLDYYKFACQWTTIEPPEPEPCYLFSALCFIIFISLRLHYDLHKFSKWNWYAICECWFFFFIGFTFVHLHLHFCLFTLFCCVPFFVFLFHLNLFVHTHIHTPIYTHTRTYTHNNIFELVHDTQRAAQIEAVTANDKQ